jgi:demethylmenaquinone methyltransferase/2-methoxy-6-polyprenyl-1,4-benzoquinol methylase
MSDETTKPRRRRTPAKTAETGEAKAAKPRAAAAKKPAATKATAKAAPAGAAAPKRGKTAEASANAAAMPEPKTNPTPEPQVSDPAAPEPRTTHFGYETVEEAEKAGRVHGVFSSVASRYDLMNDLMSARIHRLWKEAMVDWLKPRPGLRGLDVAGGTGDIAFRILSRVKGDGDITVLDMTEAMLVEGRRRAEAERIHGVDWVCGDAMALPFPDAAFDAYTISFGIRNVTRIEEALSEAFRVLAPGGRLMVLEFSQIPNDALQWLYDRYSFNVIPLMGQMVTGDRDSYQYLVESIRRFPDQDRFAAMIREAGFEQVKYRNLSLGIAALHSGWKL